MYLDNRAVLASTLSREVAGHLQVLALAEGHSLALGPLVAMVEGAGCVRKALLQLQLFCQSGDTEQERQVKNIPHTPDSRFSALSCYLSALSAFSASLALSPRSALCYLLSALLTPVTQEEEQEPLADLKAAQPDVKKWFRHLDSKERRGGSVVPGRVLPRPAALPYSHALWWSSLPQCPAPAKHAPYPLEAGAGAGRIDPLRNKELYDDEASEDEAEVEAVKEKVGVKEVLEVTPVSREMMAVNKAALGAMARHLDTLASQVEGGEAVALSSSLSTSLLASLEPSPCPALREEVEGGGREEVLDSDLVVHRLVMGRRERVEVVAVVRGIARLEEGRRGQKDASSRRGASKRSGNCSDTDSLCYSYVLNFSCLLTFFLSPDSSTTSPPSATSTYQRIASLTSATHFVRTPACSRTSTFARSSSSVYARKSACTRMLVWLSLFFASGDWNCGNVCIYNI